MKGNQAGILIPSASFVVERKPAIGYHVTSAEGACAEAWKGHALELLKSLGQPDPNGPEEYFRWVGPSKPSGQYVGVAVRLLPNGEARFHQAWFQLPGWKMPLSWYIVLMAIGMLFISLGAGIIVGPFVQKMLFGKEPVAGDSSIVPGHINSSQEIWREKLQKRLKSSRNVRLKIQKYLSQEEFGASLSNQVIDEKPSVRLIDILDKAPQSPDVRLSNLEVNVLLEILKALEELDK